MLNKLRKSFGLLIKVFIVDLAIIVFWDVLEAHFHGSSSAQIESKIIILVYTVVVILAYLIGLADGKYGTK